MLIKLKPQEGYYHLTHDLVIPGEYNDPDDGGTWDMEGIDIKKDYKCSFNGSADLSPEEVGEVIRFMVSTIRKLRGLRDFDGFDYIDLSEGESK